MTGTILVVTTVEEKKDALHLGRHLLEKRLIGCAQVSGPVSSQYWWQGKVEQAEEYRLEMKSIAPLLERLEKEIREYHPYDIPEIITTELSAVNSDYQTWLLEELQQ